MQFFLQRIPGIVAYHQQNCMITRQRWFLLTNASSAQRPQRGECLACACVRCWCAHQPEGRDDASVTNSQKYFWHFANLVIVSISASIIAAATAAAATENSQLKTEFVYSFIISSTDWLVAFPISNQIAHKSDRKEKNHICFTFDRVDAYSSAVTLECFKKKHSHCGIYICELNWSCAWVVRRCRRSFNDANNRMRAFVCAIPPIASEPYICVLVTNWLYHFWFLVSYFRGATSNTVHTLLTIQRIHIYSSLRSISRSKIHLSNPLMVAHASTRDDNNCEL